MTVKAYAKINIGLDITGKLDNGYHLLESKFIPISIYDSLNIKISNEDDVTGMIIPKEENIIYKAIKLYKEKYDVKESFSVNVKKRIPSQAGLGGGSSNAAFTLIALNKILNLNVNNDELKELRKNIARLTSEKKDEEKNNLLNIYNSHPLVVNYEQSKKEVLEILRTIKDILN